MTHAPPPDTPVVYDIATKRWTIGTEAPRSFNPWSYIGGIVTVLVVEFLFIAFGL